MAKVMQGGGSMELANHRYTVTRAIDAFVEAEGSFRSSRDTSSFRDTVSRAGIRKADGAARVVNLVNTTHSRVEHPSNQLHPRAAPTHPGANQIHRPNPF